MMETGQCGNETGHDAMVCGDPKAWFPMRVTYSREMKVKRELDRLEIENFVPMKYQLKDADTVHPRRELVPAINNLIFVRSTQERISGLKSSNEELYPLRYMMDLKERIELIDEPIMKRLLIDEYSRTYGNSLKREYLEEELRKLDREQNHVEA